MNIKWLLEHVASDSLPNRPIRALGIDLGTTNSVVAEAVWNPENPEEAHIACLEVKQKTRAGRYTSALVPSVVTNFEGNRFIGEGAKRLIAEYADKELKPKIDYFFETKNEIGTNRVYHKAPQDCRTPTEIAGHVIRFLVESAGAPKPDAVVVTVPASFQVAQRMETIQAASLAGLQIDNGDLFDEPVAAYIDYLTTHIADETGNDIEPGRLLVFDFGGGTCDIAIFQLAGPATNRLIGVSPLSISRFHRLGGGDIDAAIVYGPLLDQIIEQNCLARGDLFFTDKKGRIEPALRSVAESLKVGLCREMSRRRLLEIDGERVERKLPSSHEIRLSSEMTLQLRQPSLHSADFDKIMGPFFDRDSHYSRTNEYRTEQSIFAPIDDALMRGQIKAHDVNIVLLAGGSSRIPACNDQIREYFSSARILQFDNHDDCKFAVARGAAMQALAKALTGGAGLVTTVCQDDISIRSKHGLVPLIPRGTSLPYPANDNKATCDELAVPCSSEHDHVTLRIEVVAGDEQRLLFRQPWEITPPVSRGEPLRLEYSYDANQVLQLDLAKREAPRAPRFQTQLESPLSHVVNSAEKEIEVEALERRLGAGAFSGAQRLDKLQELADLLSDLGRREKALDIFKALQREGYHPRSWLLNRMGILYNEMADYQSAARFYREATEADITCGVPLYNLALMLKQQGDLSESIKAADEAIVREREGSYFVLRAELAAKDGDKAGESEFMSEAFRAFSPPPLLSDFELNAFIRGARLSKDNARLAEGEEELERRNLPLEPLAQGDFPIMSEGA